MSEKEIKKELERSSYMYKKEMKSVQFDGHDMVNFAEYVSDKKMLEFLIEIKNECFDKPGDTFQEAYANICLKIVDKIKELK